jgi:hypothetical protein
MALILFAIGLGYLQAGSNLLQRDMSGSALNRPLYANGSASPLPHYTIAILAMATDPAGAPPLWFVAAPFTDLRRLGMARDGHSVGLPDVRR